VPAACPCVYRQILPQNAWILIGLTCDPGSETVLDLFGDDFAGAIGATWAFYERDEAGEVYRLLDLTDTMSQGEGYWAKTTEAGRTAGFTGDFPITSGGVGGVASSPLTPSVAGTWNMKSNPVDTANWADVKIKDDIGTVHTLAQADTDGLIQRAGFTYPAGSYQCVDDTNVLCLDSVSRGEGFWIKAFDNGSEEAVEIQFPAGSLGPIVLGGESQTDPLSQPSQPSRPRKLQGFGTPSGNDGWYLRIVATSAGLRDFTSGLGEYPDALDAWDEHDLVELRPDFPPFLTVVFPHPDWGAKASEWYTTDFHRLRGGSRHGSWLFEVRSDELRQVTLDFEGPAEILDAAVLKDLETGSEYPLSAGSLTFTLADTEHEFELCMGRCKAKKK